LTTPQVFGRTDEIEEEQESCNKYKKDEGKHWEFSLPNLGVIPREVLVPSKNLWCQRVHCCVHPFEMITNKVISISYILMTV
jgi:hypothetical protein